MTISNLVVKIGADISELQSAMQKVSNSVKQAGDRMTSLGKTITTRVTAPIAALSGVAVKAFGEQERAELRLRAALAANGRQVDSLFKTYNDFAKEMQRTTVIGDEVTIAMLAQAEALGLTGDTALRAVRNSIAMQSAFDVNAKSALRYTAALEQGNSTMLARYIPALRDLENESDRVAEAQRILGNAFSAAEADAQGTLGSMEQMRNAFGDLLEVVGKVVSESLVPMTKRIKELFENLQNVNPATIKMGVAIAGVASAIGPLLISLGLFTKALALALSPINLLIVGLAGIALAGTYLVKNLQAIGDLIVEEFKSWVMAALSAKTLIEKIIVSIASLAPGVAGATARAMNTALKIDQGVFDRNKTEFQSMGEFFKDVIGDIGSAFNWLSTMTFGGLDNVKTSLENNVVAPMSRVIDITDELGAQIESWNEDVTFEPFVDKVLDMSNALETSITNAATSFAESMGKMIAGGDEAGSFFDRLLSIVADFAVQFGKIVVAMGVAALEIQTSLLSGPAGALKAIAAGSALIALGSAAKSLISGGIGGSSGGAVGQNFEPFARDAQAFGKVEFRIDYDTLVGVLDNGSRRRGRIG